MLGWLKRRNGSSDAPPVVRSASVPAWHVTFDDDRVELKKPDGSILRLMWTDLGSVGIITTPDGPAAPDLFWLLQSHDRRTNVIVPMGAEGEQALLHEMQKRLTDFDNMTVVEAMSSTDAAGFVVWQGTPSPDDAPHGVP